MAGEFKVPDGKTQFDFLIHDLSHPLYVAPPLSGSGCGAPAALWHCGKWWSDINRICRHLVLLESGYGWKLEGICLCYYCDVDKNCTFNLTLNCSPMLQYNTKCLCMTFTWKVLSIIRVRCKYLEYVMLMDCDWICVITWRGDQISAGVSQV